MLTMALMNKYSLVDIPNFTNNFFANPYNTFLLIIHLFIRCSDNIFDKGMQKHPEIVLHISLYLSFNYGAVCIALYRI